MAEQHSNLDPSDDLELRSQDAGDPQQGPIAAEFEQLQAELEATKDRLLRGQAELENFRRRMQRELQDERRFANQPLLTDLLPVLDNIERAIEAAQQSADGSGLLEGFKMVYQLLVSVLEKHHCTRVAAEGLAFDPAHHQAILQEPSSARKAW